MSSDETIKIELYRDAQDRENNLPEKYWVVQVFRPPQDLMVFSTKGGSPRWENYYSGADQDDVDRKFFEASEVYTRVQIVEYTRTVLDV